MNRKKRANHRQEDRDLTQDVADYLIHCPKGPVDEGCPISLIDGQDVEIDLTSLHDPHETFRVLITNSGINVRKVSFHLLARHTVALLRLDTDGPPHLNPDKQIIDCPHLHRYRAGEGTTWAEPSERIFGTFLDPLDYLEPFLQYCNVVQALSIRKTRGMFR